MPNFLAIYNGVALGADETDLSEQARADFMSAWGAWAQIHAASFVDPGAPLFRKKRLNGNGDAEDFTDSKTGYAIVTADSLDEAVGIFSTHPHLALLEGNFIEVLECPPVPR